MKQSDKYAEILKKGDLRATKQRYAILEVLTVMGHLFQQRIYIYN